MVGPHFIANPLKPFHHHGFVGLVVLFEIDYIQALCRKVVQVLLTEFGDVRGFETNAQWIHPAFVLQEPSLVGTVFAPANGNYTIPAGFVGWFPVKLNDVKEFFLPFFLINFLNFFFSCLACTANPFIVEEQVWLGFRKYAAAAIADIYHGRWWRKDYFRNSYFKAVPLGISMFAVAPYTFSKSLAGIPIAGRITRTFSSEIISPLRIFLAA